MARPRPIRLRALPLEDRAVPAAMIADPSFGVNGFLTLPDSATASYSKAVATPDGGVLFVGTVDGVPASNRDIVLLKLTAAGAIDATFGTAGRATLDSGFTNVDATPANDSFEDIVVLADGRIQVSGDASYTATVALPGGGSFTTFLHSTVAYRLSAAGTLDPTYDADGKLVLGSSSSDSRTDAPNAHLLPDGSLVGVFGSTVFTPGSPPPGNQDLYLEAFRVTPGGTFDPTFDGDGKAKILLGSSVTRDGRGRVQAENTGLFVRPDGSVLFGLIVVTTTTNPNPQFADVSTTQLAVAQLTPAGALADIMVIPMPKPRVRSR